MVVKSESQPTIRCLGPVERCRIAHLSKRSRRGSIKEESRTLETQGRKGARVGGLVCFLVLRNLTVSLALAAIAANGSVELATADAAARAHGATASISRTSPQAAASYNYVSKAVLPVGAEFLRTFRRAKPSEKQAERHVAGMHRDNTNVTKLTVSIKTRVYGDRLPRGKAYYRSDAFFRGPAKPKNLVEMYVDKHAEAHQYRDRGFTFNIGRTKYSGPFGITTPKLWTVDAWITGSGYKQFDSCTISGGRGYNPVLSESTVDAGIREAIKVLRQARVHKPLKRQKNVFVGTSAAKEC